MRLDGHKEPYPLPILKPSRAGGSTAASLPRTHVDWVDSKSLNEWERMALELSEKRSKPGYGTRLVVAGTGAS